MARLARQTVHNPFWMLLAVLHIVRDGRWRWTILLGVAYATVILAGAPGPSLKPTGP